jgi:hypothetical protein
MADIDEDKVRNPSASAVNGPKRTKRMARGTAALPAQGVTAPKAASAPAPAPEPGPAPTPAPAPATSAASALPAPAPAYHLSSRKLAFQYALQVLSDGADVKKPSEHGLRYDDDITVTTLHLANTLRKAKSSIAQRGLDDLSAVCARLLLANSDEHLDFTPSGVLSGAVTTKTKLYLMIVALYIYDRVRSLRLPLSVAHPASASVLDNVQIQSNKDMIANITGLAVGTFENSEAILILASAIREAIQDADYTRYGWSVAPIALAAEIYVAFVHRERFYLIGDAIRKSANFRARFTYINIERELSNARSSRNASSVALYLEILGTSSQQPLLASLWNPCH